MSSSKLQKIGKSMQNSELQLQSMLRTQQQKELSSEDQSNEQPLSRSTFRKPLKQPFSNESDDSSNEQMNTVPALPPLAQKPKLKSAIQQAQQSMKWDKQQRLEIQILAKLDGTGMKDKKIKQLASKYKALNIAYEKQRTIRKNFQNQLNQTLKQNKNQPILQKIERSQNNIKNESPKKAQKCVNCLQQDKKIMQMRLKNQSLKSDLNKAHRVITRQVGQNFQIDKVLSDQNGWKGRQQKIQRLKGRVKELEQKLQLNGVNVSHMSGFTQVSNAALSSTTRSSALIAQNKRKEMDNLRVQVQALKSENDLLQGKVKSFASRKSTLEAEIKEVKSQFQRKKLLLIEKSDNDDKFIALLQLENQKLKREERVVTKVVYKDNNEEVERLRREVQVLKKGKKQGKIENLEKIKNNVKQRESKRQVSAEKKEEITNEYLKGNKYLKQLSAEDEEQIYRAWKISKGK